MKSIPSLISLEIALIFARLAAQEELTDPGGEIVSVDGQCSICGYVPDAQGCECDHIERQATEGE